MNAVFLKPFMNLVNDQFVSGRSKFKMLKSGMGLMDTGLSGSVLWKRLIVTFLT